MREHGTHFFLGNAGFVTFGGMNHLLQKGMHWFMPCKMRLITGSFVAKRRDTLFGGGVNSNRFSVSIHLRDINGTSSPIYSYL